MSFIDETTSRVSVTSSSIKQSDEFTLDEGIYWHQCGDIARAEKIYKKIHINQKYFSLEIKKKPDIKNNLDFFNNLKEIFSNILKYRLNRPLNYFEEGDLGQKYFINTNYKKELVDLYKKTSDIVRKRAKKISKQNFLFFTIRIKNFLTRLIKYFFIKKEYRQNMPGFSDSIDRILYNLNIYSTIIHKNNKDVFYLSPKSNLSKVRNIKFLNFKDLKI